MIYQTFFITIIIVLLAIILFIAIDIIFCIPSLNKGIVISKKHHINYTNGVHKTFMAHENKLNILFSEEYNSKDHYVVVSDFTNNQRFSIKCTK